MEAKERAIEHFSKAYLQAKLAEYDGVIIESFQRAAEFQRQHFSLLMKRFLGSEPSSEDLGSASFS